MVVVSSLKRGEHDPPRNSILILRGRSTALIIRFTHHEDSIGIEAKAQLDLSKFHHGDAHGVLQLLLGQVLDLEFLLIYCGFILQSRLLLPL